MFFLHSVHGVGKAICRNARLQFDESHISIISDPVHRAVKIGRAKQIDRNHGVIFERGVFRDRLKHAADGQYSSPPIFHPKSFAHDISPELIRQLFRDHDQPIAPRRAEDFLRVALQHRPREDIKKGVVRRDHIYRDFFLVVGVHVSDIDPGATRGLLHTRYILPHSHGHSATDLSVIF